MKGINNQKTTETSILTSLEGRVEIPDAYINYIEDNDGSIRYGKDNGITVNNHKNPVRR